MLILKSTLLFCFIISFSAIAQQPKFLKSPVNKSYIGVSVNSTHFEIYYKDLTINGTQWNFIPIPYIYFGKNLNDRASIQLGIAYGNNNEHRYVTYYGKPDEIIEYHDYSRTQGLIMPVTMRFIILNSQKRLPIYATASFIPTYGRTKIWATEVQEDITTTSFPDKADGWTAYFTAGLGVNYKIWKNISGFTEIILNKSNLAGGNKHPLPLYKTLYSNKYIGTGINYNFK